MDMYMVIHAGGQVGRCATELSVRLQCNSFQHVPCQHSSDSGREASTTWYLTAEQTMPEMVR